jgi:type VI secretion system protein ImpG
MSIRQYFDAEMRLLHEAAQIFAEAYPEQAGLLNLNTLRDRDPSIERLLEGFAYLTAQIRQRIDDDVPEVCSQFLRHAWPQLLAPFPAVTIVEFSARKQQLNKSFILPRGTVLQTAPVGEEQTACHFTTTAAVKLNPLELIEVQHQQATNGGTLLSLYFQCDQPCYQNSIDLSQLQLYLHADPIVALECFWALSTQVHQCYLMVMQQRYPLKIKNMQHVVEEMLLPPCDRSLHGLHLLHDYFTFREKYLFLEIQDLETVVWPKNVQQFVINIHCRHSFPPDVIITKQCLRLHCVPAINLYTHSSEPIQMAQHRYEYPLVADLRRPQSVFIHSVDKVEGTHHLNGDRINFTLMQSFQYRENKQAFYQINYRDVGKEIPLHYLIIAGDQQFTPHDISCQLKVSNGHYPRQQLSEGAINQVIDVPNFIQVKNITRPSAMLLPPQRKDYQWQLISCMSFNTQSLMQKDNLQALLALFEWTKREEQQRKITAITHVECLPVHKISQGAITQGIEIQLLINEEGFNSWPDIYLYGCVLQQFFCSVISVNYFVRTKIICHPSQREFLWTPQIGQNLPL